MTAPSWHTLAPERQRAVIDLLRALARRWRHTARAEHAAPDLVARIDADADEVDAAAARLEADTQPPGTFAPSSVRVVCGFIAAGQTSTVQQVIDAQRDAVILATCGPMLCSDCGGDIAIGRCSCVLRRSP